MTDDTRWTPVLNGDVYCSPACGSKCKKAAYDRAVSEAATLAASLGTGWATEVWENMGWHYSVVKGAGRVRPNRMGDVIAGTWTVPGYTAVLHSAKDVNGTAETAAGALDIAVQYLRSSERQIASDIAALLE